MLPCSEQIRGLIMAFSHGITLGDLFRLEIWIFIKMLLEGWNKVAWTRGFTKTLSPSKVGSHNTSMLQISSMPSNWAITSTSHTWLCFWGLIVMMSLSPQSNPVRRQHENAHFFRQGNQDSYLPKASELISGKARVRTQVPLVKTV